MSSKGIFLHQAVLGSIILPKALLHICGCTFAAAQPASLLAEVIWTGNEVALRGGEGGGC
eukprot:10943253-Alexandrium_andersonii.AAC.1